MCNKNCSQWRKIDHTVTALFVFQLVGVVYYIVNIMKLKDILDLYGELLDELQAGEEIAYTVQELIPYVMICLGIVPLVPVLIGLSASCSSVNEMKCCLLSCVPFFALIAIGYGGFIMYGINALIALNSEEFCDSASHVYYSWSSSRVSDSVEQCEEINGVLGEILTGVGIIVGSTILIAIVSCFSGCTAETDKYAVSIQMHDYVSEHQPQQQLQPQPQIQQVVHIYHPQPQDVNFQPKDEAAAIPGEAALVAPAHQDELDLPPPAYNPDAPGPLGADSTHVPGPDSPVEDSIILAPTAPTAPPETKYDEWADSASDSSTDDSFQPPKTKMQPPEF